MNLDDGQSTACGNCGAAMTGEFCAACGQRRARRLSFRRSLADGWAQVADLDFALARTFAGMCRRPGALVREYLAGRRRHYSNPFRYAFVVTTVAVIAIGVLDIDITMPGIPLDTERDRAAVRLIITLMSYLFFPTILLLAWLQWWVGRKGRFAYAEVLVFDAYCLSHAGLFSRPVAGCLRGLHRDLQCHRPRAGQCAGDRGLALAAARDASSPASACRSGVGLRLVQPPLFSAHRRHGW